MTVLAPEKGLVRVHGRGALLSILEKELLLTSLKVAQGGRFVAETKDWDSYWEPLRVAGTRRVQDSLDEFHLAWRKYLRSGFGTELRREFCFRFFSLLDVFLSEWREAKSYRYKVQALQAMLGFECFGITAVVSYPEVLGAGTCTLRNPCYLLAKLKMPDVPDDPQFLPIITVAGTGAPELFYHYRQYALSPDSQLSLLLYPAVAERSRFESFRLINSLAGGLSYAIDPWIRERAQRLCQGIIHPILQTYKPINADSASLEFIDIGAGSGNLAASLCRQVKALCESIGLSPKFRIWSVDLDLADPSRFFRSKKLRGLVDSLMFLGDDYRGWLSKPQPLPARNGLRIALVSKLFNNLSRFSIQCVSHEDSQWQFSKAAPSADHSAYLPHICLAPTGVGPEALALSKVRVGLREGRGLVQPSLSEYYRGLYLALVSDEAFASLQPGLFLPVRTFNPNCLVTTSGDSVIARLMENCDYVIIEDADLTPKDLVEHMAGFSLESISVRDVTKPLRLTGNHAYVLGAKTRTEKPDFSGEDIW